MRCLGCDLLRTWPQPDPSVVHDLYEQDAYHDSRTVGWEDDAAWHRRADGVLAALPGTPAAILDFGAGRGHLIRALREMEILTEGVEPAAAARAHARDTHGIQVFATLEGVWPRRFDAVVALHSLEHVEDPVQTLKQLCEVLQPGGHVFAEVPHAGGAGMLSGTRREAVLDLPLHLHHFTPRTLSAVLARSGYEVETVRLFNSAAVERLLALLATLNRRSSATDDLRSRPQDRTGARRVAASVWTRGLIPALRHALPGDKFQIVARRR